MYDVEFHFITFILFSGFLSDFGFEWVIPKPNSIRILGLTFRSEPINMLMVRSGYRGFSYHLQPNISKPIDTLMNPNICFDNL